MRDIVLALVSRLIFAVHAIIAVYKAQQQWEEDRYWLLLCPIGLLLVETLFTIGLRGGEEYSWMSPCVLLYLGGVVPAIWFLEMKNFDDRNMKHWCSTRYWGKDEPGCRFNFSTQNLSYISVEELEDANQTLVSEQCLLLKMQNENKSAEANEVGVVLTTLPQQIVTTAIVQKDQISALADEAKGRVDELMASFDIFSRPVWVLILHQTLLFILIIGRWLLPTGEGISRDELSQLLLVFIGVGADILEFVTETIKEEPVRCNRFLIMSIMGFWSWSTLQFTLVLTAAQARRPRAVGIYDESAAEEVDTADQPKPGSVGYVEPVKKGACASFCSNVEVWGIMSTLILQDGPFLAMRLYIMIARKVVHQMIVFFTCKNLLVFVLQIYRLIILATKKDDAEEEPVAILLHEVGTARNVDAAKQKFAAGLRKRSNNKTEPRPKTPADQKVKVVNEKSAPPPTVSESVENTNTPP